MDWREIGIRLGPVLTSLWGVGALVGFIIFGQMWRMARITSFTFVREQSQLNGRRALILAILAAILAVASGGWWGCALYRPEIFPSPILPPTATLIPTPTPRTPTPTGTPTPTLTVTPTPTPTPIPLDAQLPAALLTPFPQIAITPGPQAALVALTLAAGQQNGQPINPESTFPPGTSQVYAFFTFDGMARNVPWLHVWYVEVDQQMVEYWSAVELWSFAGARGDTWRYINVRPGKYELHIYVGRHLQQKVPFVVRGHE